MFLSSGSQMLNMKDVFLNLTSGVSPSLYFHILVSSLVFRAKETEYKFYFYVSTTGRGLYMSQQNETRI